MLTSEPRPPHAVASADSAVVETVAVRVIAAALVGQDPVGLYTTLHGRLGPREVFLTENLAGPEEDRRGAVVGWGRLATIRVFADHLELDGVPPLRPVLDRLAARVGLLPEGDRRWRFDGSADVWQTLREAQRMFRVETDLPPTRFAFGFLLSAGYGTAWHLESLPDRPADSEPDIELALFQHSVIFHADGVRHQYGQSAYFPAAEPVPASGPAATQDGGVPAERCAAPPEAPPPIEVDDSVDRNTFLGWVERCLRHIGIGDIYQIQIGHRIDVRSHLTPLQVYLRLRAGNPSPHMYLLPRGTQTLIGASPELLFRTENDTVVMRPIAGTTRRERGGEGNEERLRALLNSTKEQAEHIMLVDLCRNDISRVARPHSLSVDRLMNVETFSHVFHLVSTVSARLEPRADVWEMLRATFPAGTMTGAPKIRAMEIIAEIEREPRGMYAGAVGLVDLRGWSELALCIRTIVHDGARYSTQSSAGVVAQSEPDREWAETLAKMAAAYWALTGEELRP